MLGPAGRPEQFDEDVRDTLDRLVALQGLLSSRGWSLVREESDAEILTWSWAGSHDDLDEPGEWETSLWVKLPEELALTPLTARVSFVGDALELPERLQPRPILLADLTEDLLVTAEKHRRRDERPTNWRRDSR